MDVIVAHSYMIPPPRPHCKQFTIKFKKPINLEIIKKKCKLNEENINERGIGGWFASQKTPYGNIKYSSRCIQVIIPIKHHNEWSKRFVPFFEKMLGFKIKHRSFTDCGEIWSIAEDRSFSRRIGLTTFWEDLIGYYGLEFE